MKIVLIVVFILTACGLFLLLSGILKLPTLRTGRAMMQSGKKEKKLQKTLDAFYMDGAAYLGKYIFATSRTAGSRSSGSSSPEEISRDMPLYSCS